MVSRILKNVPLGRLRLAEIDDVPAIVNLITESMAMNFRIDVPNDVVYLLETCILSICQLDINETIVGFLALKDFPLIPSVNPAAWVDFVWTKFKAIEMNARNTIFVHMLCWNVMYSREVVDSMLKSVFMHDPYLQFIGMMKMLINHQLLVPGQSRAEASFKRMQVLERGVPGDQLPSLWVADRKDVSPRLRIRRAVEEDNDDIVPIIERHSARLRELYGEFYVSELISRHPESERVLLVCEHKELAVGVMCLNTQINYEALEENFELSPFAGLRHIDIPPTPRDQDSVISIVPTKREFESLLDANVEELIPKDMKSRVTWVFEEDEFKEVHKELDKATHQSFSQLDILNLLEEDEDELEYDIVNIDKDLLRLPRLFTSADLVNKQKYVPSVVHYSVFTPHFRYPEDFKLDEKESAYDNKYIDNWTPKKLSNASGTCISTQGKPPEPARYSGRPNAFLLEMFAMHPDYDERYGFDMLEAAYELFPDKDYCVMCLPSSHTCFPLLEHFTLVTPFSFRMRFINETLYVAHINSVRGDVRVRNAEVYDIPHLQKVLEHATRINDLLDLVEESFHSASLIPFVFLSQNLPIGLAVIGPLEDATSIRTQYDLEIDPRRSGTDASILACVMSPIMEPHGRWYLRDLLRQTKYTTLFWVCRLFAEGDASPTRNLMSLASYMMPVRRRRSIPNYIGNKNLDKIVKDIATPFALWSIERPLTSLPKVHVNNSIVVVGASRTGLAFLEALLLGPSSKYLTFTNLTLVSQHGLPAAADLKSIPFYYYVDVMSAVMVKIDRKKKCIHLKGSGVKFYDELILTCGQQFQHPDYLRNAFEIAKEIEKGKPCNRVLMSDPKYLPDSVPSPSELPENVMLINSPHEANICLRKLKRMISDARDTSRYLCSENKIVVYGACLEAYSCIAGLLEIGVKPEYIAFVECFPPEDNTQMRVNCFNNETIDERVQASIEKLGITTYRRCYFHGWSVQQSRAERLRLTSALHAVHVPCFALFYYGVKAIDLNAFKAINECGLVYDGGLVVGPLFETNDPYIFGAGPCTKYSRRLYAQQYLHKYYSSEDVGEALAMLLLQKLDPFVKQGAGVNAVPSEIMQRYSSSLLSSSRPSASSTGRLSFTTTTGRWEPVMKFNSPLVQSATMPGPLHYMQVRRPGKETPMAVQLILPRQGHVLITDKMRNYFRLQINALHCVDSIDCLSNKPFSCDTLSQLYGKHEAYFNNLLKRFNMNLISDLFDYFTQPWIAALYQEQFSHLLYDIYERGGNMVKYLKQKISFTLYPAHSRVYEIIKTKYDELFGRSKTDDFLPDSPSEGLITYENSCQECGQNEKLRRDASLYWKAVRGEKVVYTKLTKFLIKNVITNMQYTIPEPEL